MLSGLPHQAMVQKRLPKEKLYEKARVSSSLRRLLIDQIESIVWRYKLAESTIGIPKTEHVEEIQVFQIHLKQKLFPKAILTLIDKAIPYPILYELVYKDDVAYGILYEETYYFSDWNQSLIIDFGGSDLEKVYQHIVASFVFVPKSDHQDFHALIEIDKQRKGLEKEIETLQNKLRKEKQFNRQVAINQQIQQKKILLQQLTTTI